MQDSVAFFAVPVGPSQKRPSKHLKKSITIKNMQQSHSTNDIMAARPTKVLSASMTELPSYEAATPFQDKENGHPNTPYLTKSHEIVKMDGICFNNPSLQAHAQQLGIRNDFPCTPRFVHQPEELPKPLLPTVEDNKNPELRMIDSETLATLIVTGSATGLYEKVIIIDCRFDYEFEGGHIRDAININATHDLEDLLFHPDMLHYGNKLCIILHCEFSSQRGPKMYRHLRSLDRTMNKHNYPQLSFPEIYVLRGGYREFFKTHRYLCEPDCYIEMNDPDYAPQLKEAMRKGSRNARKHRSRSCSELDFAARVRAMQNHSRLLASQPIQHPLAASTVIPAPSSPQRMAMDVDDDLMDVETASPSHKVPQSRSTSVLDFSHRRSHSGEPRSPSSSLAKRSLASALSFEGIQRRSVAEPSDFTPRPRVHAPPAPDFGAAAAHLAL